MTPNETIGAFLADGQDYRPVATGLASLAELVDRAAYHPVPPAGSDGELAWEQHDIAVRQLLAERSVWQRWRMRLDRGRY